MDLTRPAYEMPPFVTPREAPRVREEEPVTVESVALASGSFAVAIVCLAAAVAAVIAVALWMEKKTFVLKTAEEQAAMSAPRTENGDPFHLGATQPFDHGEGVANLEKQLPAANMSCGEPLSAGSTIHVKGTYDPSGYMQAVEIDRGVDPESARCMVKTLMSASVDSFGGPAQTVEGDITLWAH